ncbi:MAG: hypothetical protein ACRDD7_01175 [Peptostreptococcaceae bacterium]
MPTISGVLAYDPNNSYTFPNAAPAQRIVGVPIVLQDTSTNRSLTVLTDATGAFSFINVPAGSYILVESWGATGGITSPGDFTNAVVNTPPTPLDPPITQAPNPPATATRLQSLTRNTIPLTVTTANLTGQNFVDGPITEQPLVLQDASMIGPNLITVAQSGEWGTLPAGTTNGLIPAIEPYPGVVPSEVYTPNPAGVAGGSAVYNVTNIAYGGRYTNLWYSIANHTTFDETSRFMVINLAGSGPLINERFFESTITGVKPNTYYIGIAWILYQQNLVIGVAPQVSVRVSNTAGNVIFQSPTPQLSFVSPPKWIEIGGVFNTGNNTDIVVSYQSIATGTLSNDLMADDFAVFELTINNFITSQKTVDKSIAKLGDTLSYTIVLNNTGTSTAQTVHFTDTIPVGTVFNNGSVSINGVNQPTLNPGTGFNIANISPGTTTTITFTVIATTIPSNGVVVNDSTTMYSFAPVSGGVTIPNSTQSNQTLTDIVNPSIIKNVSNIYSDANSTLTYTITYYNESPLTATNVVFVDTIPDGTTYIVGSLKQDNIPISGNPNPPGVNLTDIPPNTTVTLQFDVLTNTIANPSIIKNTGTISSNFTNALGDSISCVLNSNTVVTTLSTAILNSIKKVDKSHANIGDILTYTMTIINTGNTTATNILFIDTIPNDTTYINSSFNQDGTIINTPPTGAGVTLPNNLPPGSTTTITFKVMVNTIPSPNPIPNAFTTIYTYLLSPTIPNTSNSNSNLVTTQINNANLGNLTKSVDKSVVACGDIITYTINIPNIGNTTAVNVILSDTVPNGTTLVPNSILINGVTSSATSLNNLPIGNINPGATTIVSFKVTVQC